MNERINQLRTSIEPLRQMIINHKVYSVVNDLEDVKTFMQYHIFAVWDFMSLLKTLQNNLTCTKVPWFPQGSAETRYLINEIVVGEESDVNSEGKRISHFELYLDAMNQCGAATINIQKFIAELKLSGNFENAFAVSKTPKAAQEFVTNTFDVIDSAKDYLQAAIFTFGREDLIPSMFIAMINEIHKKFPEDISIFKYYIERHIEVDGDHHSSLALQMTENLCGNNQQFWQEAEHVVIQSLKSRITLWDGIYGEIVARKSLNATL